MAHVLDGPRLMIDVLIPVLGRPQRVVPLYENLTSSTGVPLRIIFVCSTTDIAEIEAVKSVTDEHLELDAPPAKGQYAKKINLAYRKTKNPWLLMGADDIVFHPGWAEVALELAADRYHVISTNDMANYFVRQGLLGTHTLIRRTYIDKEGGSLDGPGIIYHEGYSHNFVDCELSVLARQRDVFAYARNAILQHKHPAFGSAKADDTYLYGAADFLEDRTLFVQRMNNYSRDALVRRFHSAVRADKQAAVRATRRRGRSR